MNAETFTERKTKLEEFYKQRMKFNIYSIDICCRVVLFPFLKVYVGFFYFGGLGK